MNITCEKSDFQKALNIVSKAVSSKSTMPILECVLIDTLDGKIRLTANDMEICIETKITANILKEGAIAADAKILIDIVRKLPDGLLSFHVDDDFNICITCVKSIFNIKGRDSEDFSKMPDIKTDNDFMISKFTLKESIRQTIFSVSNIDLNKTLCGELFHLKGEEFRVVAIDGHRVSFRKNLTNQAYDEKKVIVPAKALNEISRIIDSNTDEYVNIRFTENHILFSFDETIVLSRLIDGQFFPYENMMKSDYVTKVVINRGEFLSSIERAILLVRDDDFKPVILNIIEDIMEVNIVTSMGKLNDEVMINFSGENIKIGFNPRFLIEALKVIDEEEVTMYLLNNRSPVVIKDEEENYVYFILPVHFVEESS